VLQDCRREDFLGAATASCCVVYVYHEVFLYVQFHRIVNIFCYFRRVIWMCMYLTMIAICIFNSYLPQDRLNHQAKSQNPEIASYLPAICKSGYSSNGTIPQIIIKAPTNNTQIKPKSSPDSTVSTLGPSSSIPLCHF